MNELICPYSEKYLCTQCYGFEHYIPCTGKSEACLIRRDWIDSGCKHIHLKEDNRRNLYNKVKGDVLDEHRRNERSC